LNATDLVVYRGKGFSIALPSDWQLLEGFAGAEAVFASPGSGEDDEFRTTLNVVREPAPRGKGIDELVSGSVGALHQLLTNFQLLDRQAVRFDQDGLEGERLLFAYRQGVYVLTAEQWYATADDALWTVTATADSDSFDDWADLLRQCLRSFATSS